MKRVRSESTSAATPDSPGAGTDAQRELLRRLELDITRKLDGLLHGEYGGLVPGRGTEPGETREYQPGDDVRRIDWNVTARTQRTHVRESIADRELETHVLVDLSASLNFGTTTQEKRDLALVATAAVGFLTQRVGNRVGAVLLTVDGIAMIPPRQGRQHLLALLHRVQSVERSDGTTPALAEGMAKLAAGARRRGLAVIISDFLGPATWSEQMTRLALRHDVLAIELVDPRELELPDVGLLTVVDPETGATRDVRTGSARFRASYAAAAAEQREATAAAIRRAGGDHLVLRTDRDWLLDLARFVTLRRKRNELAPAARTGTP